MKKFTFYTIYLFIFTFILFITPISSLSQTINRGKALYEQNCSKCHALIDPLNFLSWQWKNIFSSHERNLSLTKQEKKLILDYLKNENDLFYKETD